MSTEKKEPSLFFNESMVEPSTKWNPLKIAEASIPMIVSLDLADNVWNEVKVTVKKRPDGTMLCRSVSVLVVLVDPLENENLYPVFKLNSTDSCRWTEYEDCEAWDTGCGHAFYIENGTPQENDMKFCCYCGKTISS